jgi:hypothetical protein
MGTTKSTGFARVYKLVPYRDDHEAAISEAIAWYVVRGWTEPKEFSIRGRHGDWLDVSGLLRPPPYEGERLKKRKEEVSA